jgi:hypothetical protein
MKLMPLSNSLDKLGIAHCHPMSNLILVPLSHKYESYHLTLKISGDFLIMQAYLPYTLDEAGTKSMYGNLGFLLKLNSLLNAVRIAQENSKLIVKSSYNFEDLTEDILVRNMDYFNKSHEFIHYKIQNPICELIK